MSRLCIVTATTNPERARACIESWGLFATAPLEPTLVIVVNGRAWTTEEAEATGLMATWVTAKDYLGTVAAFKKGVEVALEKRDANIIACLHDDLGIQELGWDQKVLRHFDRYPACGLLGFGGAIGLGADEIYTAPYDPMQLARVGFRSNLVDAELHGIRSLLPERVACLDGFSQVGRRAFWEGRHVVQHAPYSDEAKLLPLRPWQVLTDLGVVHHAYDGMLGVAAKRYGWQVWYLPVRAQHFGGQTAVGDQGYSRWAEAQHGGDHELWKQAHQAFYEYGRGTLPIRL